MPDHLVRYIVGHGWAESVSDTTALPHRVLRIDAFGDVTVRIQRPGWEEQSSPNLQMSAAELALLAREARRAARRRLWARLFGKKPTPPDVPDFERLATAGSATVEDLDQLAERGVALAPEMVALARLIRERVSPMRHPDGRLDTSSVAQELTLRDRAGLPHFIAELDGPGRIGP